jgi:hypothetical protein
MRKPLWGRQKVYNLTKLWNAQREFEHLKPRQTEKEQKAAKSSERSIEQMWRTRVRMQFQLPGDGIGTRKEALFRNQAADKMTRLWPITSSGLWNYNGKMQSIFWIIFRKLTVMKLPVFWPSARW